jgi:O-antigen/teichoic acid export membrane protein
MPHVILLAKTMSLRVKALKSVPWTATTTISNVVTRFIVTLAAAHTLGPFDLGLYAIVNLVLGFAYLIADAGFSQGIISKQDARPEQLSSLYWASVLFGFAICLAVCFLSPLLAMVYGQPRLLGMLLLTALNFAVAPFGQIFQALLQKNLRFPVLGRIELLVNVSSALGAIVMLYGGLGVFSLLLSQILAAALRSLLLRIAGRTLLQVRMRLSYAEIRHFVHFGMFQIGDRAINYLGSRLDQLLIGSVLGPAALGYYNMAWMLVVDPVYRINPIITSVAFPVFAQRQSDARALRHGFLVVTKLLTTANAPLLLGFAAIAPGAVPFLLGAQWMPAVPLVELLSIIAIARTVNNPVGSLVLAVGRADKSFYWTVVQFAVQVPIYTVLLMRGGLVPATLFLCVVNWSAVFLVYIYLLRPILGSIFVRYAQAFLPPIGLALGMAVLVRMLSMLTIASPSALLIAQIAFGAIIYCGLTFWLRREDVQELAGLVATRT